MRRAFLFLAAFVLGALPALAGTRNCTSAMVTAGICPSTAYVVYTIAINTADPDGAGPLQAPSALLLDAFAGLYGYASPTPCTPDMVAGGICSAGQLGASVAVTKAQFADFQIRSYILRTVRTWNVVSATAAAEATAKALADPDIGN